MAVTAIRMPTTTHDGLATVTGGHCYVILERGAWSVKTLIREKVLAELRKLRASNSSRSCSLQWMIPDIHLGMASALDEEHTAQLACSAFEQGLFTMWYRGVSERPRPGTRGVVQLTALDQHVLVEPGISVEFREKKHDYQREPIDTER